MQFQADLLQTELFRPLNTETTSLGAAMAATVGIKGTRTICYRARDKRKNIQSKHSSYANANLYRWLKAVDCVNLFYK